MINTVVSILAFLLIALLQNSERRYDEALHKKIDLLTTAVADLVEERSDSGSDEPRRRAEELRASVELEKKL